ncbi:Regulator of chromosome condensation (RCC1) repeat protein [Calidithermus terrae]|uniref:Regulator of chromosome condensation (RCC1) repeat protein n=1 Tax=Calidithermus terrae TaxID=1408545 RepID=A0A399EDW8_9DEIN|nr:hypothetical protein [Calidithermus terrae]RIH81369.1 Regulator of chromosome condensation (RCC1) repeat protein [Calidithermus terrae]
MDRLRLGRPEGGGQHSLAVGQDGTLWSWGNNASGELGGRATPYTPVPTPVMAGVKAVAARWAHSLAVKTDGTLWAFGSNGAGQLGNGDSTDQPHPVQVMERVVAVAAGQAHTLVIRDDGTLWTFGANNAGQLGDMTPEGRNRPGQVMQGTGRVVAVAAGGDHSLVLLGDGTLWTFGANGWGQLGDGSYTSRSEPRKVLDGVMLPR